MSVLVDEKTKVIVQGITGGEGSFHTEQMLEYGTLVVSGVTPGKGGQEIHGVPVFDTVRDAVEAGDLVAEIVRKGDLVLIKASRGVALEQVIDTLRLSFASLEP